jgi:hypothetical protein
LKVSAVEIKQDKVAWFYFYFSSLFSFFFFFQYEQCREFREGLGIDGIAANLAQGVTSIDRSASVMRKRGHVAAHVLQVLWTVPRWRGTDTVAMLSLSC